MRVALFLLALAAFVIAPIMTPLGPSVAEAQIRLPSIRNKLIELALNQISSPGSFEITAGSIEDQPGGLTSLRDVKVSDGTGVWMTLDELRFSWEPSRLLSGELSITRLELIGLTVSRRPSPNAKAPELKPIETKRGLFDWPRSPINLSIQGVKLERVTIAKGVLPQPISFDAQGRALDRGNLQELSLQLHRTDSVKGDIDLNMRRDFAANTVTLDIEAREAAGGMVAAAAGLPSDAPARLTLKAEGPPEDWELTIDAGVEKVFDADGKATLAYKDRVSVDAGFEVVPGPNMSQRLRTIFGDKATLTAKITEQPDGMIEIAAGRLESPALKLDATGEFATGAGQSDLKVSLVALAPLAALTQGVAFDRFTFDGHVTGPKGALAAEGRLGLSGLTTAPVDAGGLSLHGRVAQTADGLTFSLDGAGDGLRIDRLGPDVIGKADLGAEGALAGDVLTLSRATLGSTAITAETSGTYDLKAAAGELTANLKIPRIARAAAAYGIEAEGAVAADGKVKLAGADADASFTADLDGFSMAPTSAQHLGLKGQVTKHGERIGFDIGGRGAGLVLDQVPADLTREVTLTAQGAMEGGTLTLDKLDLASPLLTTGAKGTVGIDARTLGLDYTLSTADLAPVAAAYGVTAAGAFDAAGRAGGTFAAPQVKGKVRLAGAGFEGRSYGDVTLTHDVTIGEAIEGSLALTSEGGDLGSAGVETRFRYAAPALTLDELKARVLGAILNGHAGIDLDTRLADGAFDLSIPDLRPAGRFLATPLSGGATGKVTLTTKDGKQDASADLSLSRLATDGVSLGSARARLGVNDVLGVQRIDLGVDASNVTAGPVTLATARAQARGPRRAIDFSAEAQGSVMAGGEEQPLTLSLAGRADAGSAPVQVTLSRADVAAGPDKLHLRHPLALRIGAGTVAATGLDLALPEDGSLTGEAALRPGGYIGNLALAKLPLTLLDRWAGLPVAAGLLDAHAAFDTRPGSAKADLGAEVRGLVFDKSQSGGAGFGIDATAKWNGANLTGEAEVSGPMHQPLKSTVSLPLVPGPGGVPRLSRTGPLGGTVVWSGKIGDLWALVPTPGQILDGHADIDLKFGGTIAAPRVSGRADVSDGAYQNLEAGTILTDLTMKTEIAQDGSLKISVNSNDGANGTVSATSDVHFGGGLPRVATTVDIRHATLVRRDDVTARIGGKLTLDGPVDDLALKGALRVERAEVRLISGTPPSVVELDGIRIKGAPEEKAKGRGVSRLTLDLKATAPGNIFVRGRGLDSEWKMDLTVRVDATAPVVTGRIEKVRGQLDLIGRSFDLTRGTVTFDGGRKIDPVLDVALDLEANGVRGGIRVTGRASKPELHFASVPALPEDEVLPRLLFGQSRQSLSGPEAVQLAAGVATLLSGRAGPLDAVRKAVGVDVLRVEGTTAENTTITVGRNIARGVFVGARQGLGEQDTTLTVEVQVFNGVTVDSEVDPSGGSSVGITLTKDF